jgi:hypothetical protein
MPIIEVLWRSGVHLVRVSHRGRVVWERKAGRNRKLVRMYLEKAAAVRERLIAGA